MIETLWALLVTGLAVLGGLAAAVTFTLLAMAIADDRATKRRSQRTGRVTR